MNSETEKLKVMLALMIDQRSALIAAGEKMATALVQSRVRPHILAEWQAVLHAIKR